LPSHEFHQKRVTYLVKAGLCFSMKSFLAGLHQELALAEKQRGLAEKEEQLAAELERRKLEKLRDERMIEKVRASLTLLPTPPRAARLPHDPKRKCCAASHRRQARRWCRCARNQPRPRRAQQNDPTAAMALAAAGR
jgi:hypothetical protein